MISSGGNEGGAGGSGPVLSLRTSCSGGGVSGACEDSCARPLAAPAASAANKIIAARGKCRRPSAILLLISELDACAFARAACLPGRHSALDWGPNLQAHFNQRQAYPSGLALKTSGRALLRCARSAHGA